MDKTMKRRQGNGGERKVKKGSGVIKENIYIPVNGRIEGVIHLTYDVRLFRVRPDIPLNYRPGQFFMVSVWGAGEVPISVASLFGGVVNGSGGNGILELCIRKTGLVTSAIHSLQKGQSVGLRGPYGNGFPLDISEGRDVVLVAGGVGIAPLRPLIQWFIRNRHTAGEVTLLYGSRTPDDVIFMDEVERWSAGGIKVVLTVDRGNENWNGHVGLVTSLLHEVNIDFKNAVSYICGPEVMIKAAIKELFSLGMSEELMIATLEAHMKCGVGKCGHCYAGSKYICTDGPVFSFREIKENSIFETPI